MKRNHLLAVLCACALLAAVSVGCVDQRVAQPSASLLPVTTANPPVTGSGTAHMVAVRQLDNQQSEGATADIIVTTQPGSGHVFVKTPPLVDVAFQQTASNAATVAANRAHVDPSQQDVQFEVRAPAGVTEVDGPSGGLPMAIAVYSAMTKHPTNSTVYGTGTIDNRGNVGAVGGIYSKAVAAAQSGAKVIVVPQNETVMTVSSPSAVSSNGGVDLQSQLKKDGYDVKVIGVTSVDQALPYYFS